MFIDPINKADTSSFKAIKYDPHAATNVFCPNLGLKEIVEKSNFFKLLGAQTDVYISAEKYKTAKNQDKYRPHNFNFYAFFSDPYTKEKLVDKMTIALKCVTNKDSEFVVRLEKALDRLPFELHELLLDYRSKDKKGIALNEYATLFLE